VGRPNVGKSTLFNRIVGRRAAIVEDVPGVTRDRNYGDLSWDGRLLSAVDTGGFDPVSPARKDEPVDRTLMRSVQEQARLAVDEAAAVLLVVDGREGPTAVDRAVADLLRPSGKPLFVAVNKIDTAGTEAQAPVAEFYELGFGSVHPVSAEHGRGIPGLMDAVLDELRARGTPAPEAPTEAVEEESVGLEEKGDVEVEEDDRSREIRLAIVGRPNVGKSTLVNALLREERLIVSEVAGTTRDSIDSVLEHEGRKFVVTDTAGIRRKRSIAQQVERFSVVRAMQAIDDADVVALVLDAREAGADQDARLAGLVVEKGRALVLVVNKWDVAQEAGATQRWYREELAKRLPFVSWAPVLFVSARDGKGIGAILREAERLFRQYRTRLPTPRLNELLETIQEAHPAPLSHGHPVKLYYVSMVSTAPPTLVIQASRPETIPDHYKRFVENRFREAFGLRVPLRFVYRERTRRDRPRRPSRGRRGA
jgi:GTP-binding protein